MMEDRRLVELKSRWRAGARPSELLRYLVDDCRLCGIDVIRPMMDAFSISVGNSHHINARFEYRDDDRFDRFIGEHMSPRQ